MGLCFRAGRPFWDSILVTPFLGLHFGGGPFLGVLVPVVGFGAPFWCRWSVLGLDFGASGPFWGSILVPVVRFGAPFWCR